MSLLKTAAKAAPYVLPFVKPLTMGVIDPKEDLGKELLEAGLDLLDEQADDHVKEYLKNQPDAVSDLLDQHLIRHTGKVLGTLVKHYAKKHAIKEHRADLKRIAKVTPSAWINFLASDALKMLPLRKDALHRRITNSLTPGSAEPELAPAPFVEFFRWLARQKEILGPLKAGLTPPLTQWITANLNQQLLTDLCLDTPTANAAYKDSILRFLASAQGNLDLLHAKLDATAAAINRIENSPGFDLDAYANALLQFVAPLPLAQIVNQPDLPAVRVSDVFVPLQLREIPDLDARRVSHAKEIADWDGREDDHDAPDELRQRKEEMAEFRRSSPPRDALNLRAQLILGSHILLGEAGGGKTLLSRHIAALWAMERLDRSKPDTVGGIPIYIELKDYAQALAQDPRLNLLQYCHHGCDRLRSLDQHILREHLGKWRAFFLLDGLDEVLDPALKDKIIREIIGLHEGLVRFIITSRLVDFDPAPWRESQGWQAWRIDPLDAKQQTAFIQSYHDAFFADETQRKERIARLHGKLRDFHRLAELAGTPLLLTLLCLVNREPALPETRTALYEAAARLLLHNWDFFHFGEGGPLHAAQLAPLELEEKHLILRRLAWLLMMGRTAEGNKIPAITADSAMLSANLFSETIVIEAVRSVLTELGKLNVPSYVARVPVLLRQRNSVLCTTGEAKQSFIHRTFLEFYAAWAWHEEDASWLGDAKPAEMSAEQRYAALFAPHWQLPAWRVILILHLGRAKSAFAEKLLRQLLAAGEACRLKATQTEDPEQRMAALLQQQEAILLAAECFSETPLRGKLATLDAELRKGLQALALLDYNTSDKNYRQNRTNSDQRQRAVRLYTQLWVSRPEDQEWLCQQVTDPKSQASARRECVTQLALLRGQDEPLRSLLQEALIHAEESAGMRNHLLRTTEQLWGQTGLIQALSGLTALGQLQTLYLHNCVSLESLPDLRALERLQTLSLIGCIGLHGPEALSGLTGLAQLQILWLDNCTSLESLPDLRALQRLQTLSLNGCTGLHGPEALSGLTGLAQLQTLDLDGCTGLERLPDLRALQRLQTLSFIGCTGLHGPEALSGLTGLAGLQTLILEGCTGLERLPDLRALQRLQTLYLRGCTGLHGPEALSGLTGLAHLQTLILSGCTGLEPKAVADLRRKLREKCVIHGP